MPTKPAPALRFPEFTKVNLPTGSLARLNTVAAQEGSRPADVARRGILHILRASEPHQELLNQFALLRSPFSDDPDGISFTYVNVRYLIPSESAIASLGKPFIIPPTTKKRIDFNHVTRIIERPNNRVQFFNIRGEELGTAKLTPEELRRMIYMP